MNQEEEIQYWKEKYRLSRLDNKIQQENEERVQKFKMVSNINLLIDFLNLSIHEDNEYYASKNDIIIITKHKVNNELGVKYYEFGE
jgi:hypothetical protein